LYYAAKVANSLSLVKTRIELINETFPELRKHNDTKVATLADKEQKIFSIAMGLIQDPRFLIIDELSKGLDQATAKKIIRRLLLLSKRLRISILLMEQNLSVGIEVAESIYVIRNKSIEQQNELLSIPIGHGLLPLCAW
jgi:branched-chain amino acid transport system ATP-binding protein